MTSNKGNAGSVLPLVAISLAVLMGFGGLGVDVGYWEYNQRQEQSAADAAALGGAQQLIYSGCPNQSAAKTAGQNDSASNGFTDGSNGVSVGIENPPQSGPFESANCAVLARVEKSQVGTFFTRLFGMSSGIPETTQAVAEVSQNGNGCIYLLNPSVRSIFNGDTVNSSCGILINDTATFNGDPTFKAPYIGYAGSAPIENGTTFTQATPAPMVQVADPCPKISGCNYLASNAPSTSSCTSATYNGQATALIQPGCYNSIIINGCQNVVFESGTYVFNGTTIINGEQSATGSGVTFYVTASGTPPTFNGIPNLSLSPPTTGGSTGVLYYQVPSNTQSPIFNGVTNSLSGLVYAPGASNVIVNGTSGSYVVIVAGAATFNGTSTYDLASPPPNASLISDVVLVQ